MPITTGRLLRQCRTAAGLSQEQLAKNAGVTGEYISMLESGKKGSPSIRVLEHLAKALGVPLIDLIPSPEIEDGVKRVLTDLYWLRHELTALRRLAGKDHVGLDFFKLIHVAIVADFQHRLGRVLDLHHDAFSFWTIHRLKGADVERALEAHGITLNEIRDLSAKFKPIRNQILAHTDTRADRNRVYRLAAIKAADLHAIANALWDILRSLHAAWFDKSAPSGDDYSGEDIEEIHRRYIAWRYPGRPE